MLKEIKLPEISENVNNGEVIAVLVAEGDYIEEQQDVVELETEKAAFEVPSPVAGKVAEIKVAKGQTANVGDVLITVDTEAETEEKTETKQQSETKPEKNPEIDRDNDQSENRQDADATEGRTDQTTESDRGSQEIQETKQTRENKTGPVPAAPSVRQLARELGADIEQVTGSGPAGRVLESDVKNYVRKQITKGGQPSDSSTPQSQPGTRKLPDFSRFGEVEYGELSKTRKTIADTMSYAASIIPMVTHYEKADVTDLERFRQQFQGRAEARETRLSITALIVKVTAAALRQFPQFNASLDQENERVVYKKYVNVSVAVETDRGLLVPVVKEADQKGILQVAAEIKQLAEKARNKKITPEDLQGGSFTVSNLGGIGGSYFAPIIYWPDVAILGVNRALHEPVYRDKQLQPRLMMPLALTYDHRLIDGADGARFLRWIKEALETPISMML